VQGLMMCSGYQWTTIFTLYQGTELRINLTDPDAAMRANRRIGSGQPVSENRPGRTSANDDEVKSFRHRRCLGVSLSSSVQQQIPDNLARHELRDSVIGMAFVNEDVKRAGQGAARHGIPDRLPIELASDAVKTTTVETVEDL